MKEGMKRVLIIFAALLILAAIPVTVFLAVQRQDLRKRAAPATALSLSPSSVIKNVGDEFSLDIQIDTAQNQIVAAELHLEYDPTKLEAQTITNGILFPNVLASGTIENGTASITVGATSATSPVTGSGTAATIKFRVLEAAPGTTSVTFANTTFVGALGEEATNVLVGTTPSKIALLSGSETPVSPTPVPTAPEVSTAASPTPGSGASPTPTPVYVQTLTDTFSGTDLDTRKWFETEASSGSAVLLENGKLKMTLSGTGVAAISSVGYVSGDFQAQITIPDLLVTQQSSASAFLQLDVPSKQHTGFAEILYNNQRKYFVRLLSNKTDTEGFGDSGYISVPSVSGIILKLVRVGSTVQLLTNTGNGFVQSAQLSDAYTGTGIILVGSRLWSSDSSSTSSAFFDDFSLSASSSAVPQQETSVNITITSPAEESITINLPTLKGKAPPDSTITITIYSSPVTVTVTADSQGNWSYTPQTPLEAGPHNVVVSAPGPSGTTTTASSSFIVAAGGVPPASESAVPVAGNSLWTLVLVATSTLLFIAGIRFVYLNTHNL